MNALAVPIATRGCTVAAKSSANFISGINALTEAVILIVVRAFSPFDDALGLTQSDYLPSIQQLAGGASD
jgi:hypothetical protein